jgi:hypothetical protein
LDGEAVQVGEGDLGLGQQRAQVDAGDGVFAGRDGLVAVEGGACDDVVIEQERYSGPAVGDEALHGVGAGQTIVVDGGVTVT